MEAVEEATGEIRPDRELARNVTALVAVGIAVKETVGIVVGMLIVSLRVAEEPVTTDIPPVTIVVGAAVLKESFVVGAVTKAVEPAVFAADCKETLVDGCAELNKLSGPGTTLEDMSAHLSVDHEHVAGGLELGAASL